MNWCDVLPDPPEPVRTGKGRFLTPQERRIVRANQQSLISAADQDVINLARDGLLVHRPMGG